MTRNLACLAVVGALIVAGCGDDDGTSTQQASSTTTPGEPGPQDAAKLAAAYAKAQSGGVTGKCRSARSGVSAEQYPGCIYSATYAGCYEGITGDAIGAGIREFPVSEPGLVGTYQIAMEDCSRPGFLDDAEAGAQPQ